MTDTLLATTNNTPLIRAAYTWLSKPRVNKESGGMSWGFTGIFTMDQIKQFQLDVLANQVLRAKFGPTAKFSTVDAETKFRSPFRRPGSYDPTPAEFVGKIMLPMFSKGRPVKVADVNLIAIDMVKSPEEVYAGMWVHANYTCYAYDAGGQKGVNFGLNSVIKCKNDTPLAGAPSDPANDFKTLDLSAYQNDGSVAMGSGADLDI